MSIDISQFQQTFFEESFEGLDVMESGLLALDIGAADPEAINTIFRAAHSIKGGAGTFGFSPISDFTHGLETLLDEMRSGKRGVTREAVDVMLAAVDVLRDMLGAARESREPDAARVQDVHAQIRGILGQGPAPAPAAAPAATQPAAAPAASAPASGWTVGFRPKPHLFRTGNDPVRLLRELDGLGVSGVSADLSRLPAFADYITDECYVGWNLQVAADATENDIRQIFEWVDDDCELEIARAAEPAAAPAAPVADAAPVAPLAAVPAAPERRAGEDRRQAGEDRRAAAAGAPAESSIRVGIDKVDALINLVGELVITQSMLSQIGSNFEMRHLDKLRDGLGQLERNTRELQEQVMRIRMLPISFAFNRFPRLVRDLSGRLGKHVELKMSGEQTELDKTVMEKIGDPLVHLVRNAIDHGLEGPEQREAAGKPATGTLFLNAYHEGGNIVIEVGDDGAGLNTERILQVARERGVVAEGETLSPERIQELIFHPGFSTAKQVSDVSGRGVGMDVVKRNIKDLGGVIEIDSTLGQGTTFTIRLPLTLAILDGQLVRVGNEIYIIPLVSIVESLQPRRAQYNRVAGRGELYRLRDDYLPVVRLHEVFRVVPDDTELDRGLLVVVEGDGTKAGIFVDDLLAQQQVVIKSLETNYRKVEGISGATILGDGKVAMILDVPGLIALARGAAPTTGPDIRAA